MGIKERKERERDERRELILNAASEIVASEGTDNLSVRKIASKIEYSPSIIYHYFQDKDDIQNHLMARGYQKIISALASVQVPPDQPAQRLRVMTRQYIEAALQMPDEFKAVQLSSSTAVLAFTASMFQGASEKKPALRILHQSLKELLKEENMDESTIELTAQIIAASTLGLIIKLILENGIGEEQREKLIEHYIRCIIDGMLLKKSLSSRQLEV